MLRGVILPTLPLAAFKGRPAVAPDSAAALQSQLESRMWAAADAAVLVRTLRTMFEGTRAVLSPCDPHLLLEPTHIHMLAPTAGWRTNGPPFLQFLAGCSWCCAHRLSSAALSLGAAQRLPAAAQRHAGGNPSGGGREAGAGDASCSRGACLQSALCCSQLDVSKRTWFPCCSAPCPLACCCGAAHDVHRGALAECHEHEHIPTEMQSLRSSPCCGVVAGDTAARHCAVRRRQRTGWRRARGRRQQPGAADAAEPDDGCAQGRGGTHPCAGAQHDVSAPVTHL